MYKQHMKIFIMTIIIISFLALIGASYAYYQMLIIENPNQTSISLKSKYLSVEYVDGTSQLSSSTEGYIFPGETFTKTFTIKNIGNDTAKYNIILKDVVNTFTRTQDLSFTLKIEDMIVASGTFPFENSKTIYTENELLVNSSKTYTLIVKYEVSTENQKIDINKELKATIDIEGI